MFKKSKTRQHMIYLFINCLYICLLTLIYYVYYTLHVVSSYYLLQWVLLINRKQLWEIGSATSFLEARSNFVLVLMSEYMLFIFVRNKHGISELFFSVSYFHSLSIHHIMDDSLQSLRSYSSQTSSCGNPTNRTERMMTHGYNGRIIKKPLVKCSKCSNNILILFIIICIQMTVIYDNTVI